RGSPHSYDHLAAAVRPAPPRLPLWLSPSRIVRESQRKRYTRVDPPRIEEVTAGQRTGQPGLTRAWPVDLRVTQNPGLCVSSDTQSENLTGRCVSVTRNLKV
ncbi:unnamed protein product, partial [Pylaiella littoralis]